MKPIYFIFSTKYSLRTRHTKRGDVYDVFFRIIDTNGVEKQKVLCGYASRTLAKQAHADFVTKYCQLINRELTPKKASIKFEEAYNAYIAYIITAIKESSCCSIKNAFSNHILPFFANKNLSSLSKQDYYLWQDTFLKKINPRSGLPYSRNTVLKVRGYLSTFLEWVDERYEITNILKKIKLPKRLTSTTAKTSMQFWEISDFNKFISVIDDIVYKTLFTLLFYCGCRKGEALALSDKDFNGAELHIFKNYSNRTIDGTPFKITSPKADRNFSVPLAETLISQLNKYLKWKHESNIDSTFLFGGERPLSFETVRRKFKQYIEQSQVPNIRIHDLRHSFASMLIHRGASYVVVANLIGDNPAEVIKTYGHLYESDKHKIISLL